MSEDDKTTGTGGGERDSTSDRSADRGTRDVESGGERSGGRRDRSRELLREDIERQFERASGRPRDWDADRSAEPTGRAARAAKQATAEGSPGGEQLAGIGHNSGDATPLDVSSPPSRWKKEAKAEWMNLPKTVQEAVAKGEVDVERGVQPLKQKLAELGEVEQALAPHIPVIRQFGHTPAQAVNQMFGWFRGLSERPDECFPALMRSFNYDPRRLAQAMGLGGAQQQGLTAEQQYNQAAVQAVQRMIDEGIGRHVGPIQQQFESQRQAQTEGILANWAKDKKYYSKSSRHDESSLDAESNHRWLLITCREKNPQRAVVKPPPRTGTHA